MGASDLYLYILLYFLFSLSIGCVGNQLIEFSIEFTIHGITEGLPKKKQYKRDLKNKTCNLPFENYHASCVFF